MKHCPACSSERFEPLIDFGTLPKSGVYLYVPDAPFPTIHLAHEFCSSCGLIRQKNIESASHDYTHIPRATTRQFPKYIDAIVDSLKSHGVSGSDLVIEVGSNDGGFLDRLASAGFSNLLGIEPSISCAGLSLAKDHKVVTKHWDAETAASVLQERGPARAVICRHTLEHVPRPLEFLQAIRSVLAPDGIAFIEVPDARPITHDLRGHELWDEHLHIFTSANLQLIMRRAGFSILRCNAWPERSDINLLLWATANAGISQNSSPDSASTSAYEIQLCREFEKRWKAFSSRLQADSASWPRPVYMLGASHPQTNFVHFTGLESSIDAFIDDNPAKANLLIPLAHPVPIFPASKLLDRPAPGTIIRGAFGYEEWMDHMTASLSCGPAMVARPYGFILLQSE
jgi:2-polyprenyl-3-methyl-5-hydroxy-6-metoxy-1,4-benzoquinol methylase